MKQITKAEAITWVMDRMKREQQEAFKEYARRGGKARFGLEFSPHMVNYMHLIDPAKSERRKLNRKEMAAVHEKFRGHCAYCGKIIYNMRGKGPDTMCIDHLWPICLNGIDDMENWMPSCPRCNQIKSGKPPEEFRRYMEITAEPFDHLITLKDLMRFGIIEYHPGPVVFYYEKIKGEQDAQ